jgi:glycerol dehydrogenase
MIKVMRTPLRYVQGRNSLLEMNEHVSTLGDSLFFVAGKTAMKVTKEKIEQSFEGSDKKLVFEKFNGISSMQEVDRMRELVKINKSDVIVGLGGGSAIDTAKAIAHYEKLPIVIIPTVAATDAPCTALSVIYDNEGNFDKYLFYPTNPDVVIVDTEIIAKAPKKFIVAGMGDALGTYFEGRACQRSNAKNLVNGHLTEASMALAELCYQTLLENGYKAKLAIESGAITEAVEKIIEANTYLSGVGAENAGLAVAHSIYNGFTVLEECEKTMHGNLVAFGTIVQLILENSPLEEIEEVIDFCLSVELPVTLEEIGVSNKNKESIMKATKLACAPGETIHNMLGDVQTYQLYDAILVADSLGKTYTQL